MGHRRRREVSVGNRTKMVEDLLALVDEKDKRISELESELEQIKAAIRRGDSDLKYQVGPAAEDQAAAETRIKEMDRIWERYGDDQGKWPHHVQENFKRLSEQQKTYENQYC